MERKLDVLIATHGPEGLARVAEMDLPRVDGVGYVVSWQTPAPASVAPADLPEALRRDDVAVYPTPTKGLGRNRNESIARATAPYCLLADNDLKYTVERLLAVVAAFEADPALDVATFRFDGSGKRYPETATRLGRRLPRGYYVTSFEIAFRRESVAGRVTFDPRFGVGTQYGCAEEALFLLDCRRAGLKCVFFPITITTHCGPTTGTRPYDPGVLRAQGYYIRREHGLAGLPRILLFALRANRAGRTPLASGLRHLAHGFFRIPSPKKLDNR